MGIRYHHGSNWKDLSITNPLDFWPVNSVYITIDKDFSPGNAFGGTWEDLSEENWGSGPLHFILYGPNSIDANMPSKPGIKNNGMNIYYHTHNLDRVTTDATAFGYYAQSSGNNGAEYIRYVNLTDQQKWNASEGLTNAGNFLHTDHVLEYPVMSGITKGMRLEGTTYFVDNRDNIKELQLMAWRRIA